DDGVVPTNLGLFLPGRPRLRWHEIHKSTWSDGVLRIVPAAVEASEPGSESASDYAVVADGMPVTVGLQAPGDVPKRVRERVTASVAYTSRHSLPGGGAARVVGRQGSRRARLSWLVR